MMQKAENINILLMANAACMNIREYKHRCWKTKCSYNAL